MNVSGAPHLSRFQRTALLGCIGLAVAGGGVEVLRTQAPAPPPTGSTSQVVAHGNHAPAAVANHLLRPKCPALPLCGTVVALDPGHGGPDQGASGNGLIEKTLNLDIATRVSHDLQNMGARVVSTRTGDTAVAPGADHDGELQARDDIAANARASAMVSIHTNANTRIAQNGTEVYEYRNADAASQRLATDIHAHLATNLPTADNGVKGAGYWVLKHARTPAVLTEVAYLTNPSDAQHLANPAFRQKAADAIAAGVEDFLVARHTPAHQVAPTVVASAADTTLAS